MRVHKLLNQQYIFNLTLLQYIYDAQVASVLLAFY